MHIVIKLPDKDYSVILTKIMLACYGCEIIELPKGHGRLIDADALNISHGVFLPGVEGNTLGCPMDAVFADEIDDAPTIIEADEAEQEAATR